jgi:hypothetical protein
MQVIAHQHGQQTTLSAVITAVYNDTVSRMYGGHGPFQSRCSRAATNSFHRRFVRWLLVCFPRFPRLALFIDSLGYCCRSALRCLMWRAMSSCSSQRSAQVASHLRGRVCACAFACLHARVRVRAGCVRACAPTRRA